MFGRNVLFLDPPSLAKPDASTTNKEHGRMEIRRIWVSNDPQVYDCTDFPYSQQFFMVGSDVGPRIMASIRNIAISLARQMGFRYIPDVNRTFTFNSRKKVLAMWGID